MSGFTAMCISLNSLKVVDITLVYMFKVSKRHRILDYLYYKRSLIPQTNN